MLCHSKSVLPTSPTSFIMHALLTTSYLVISILFAITASAFPRNALSFVTRQADLLPRSENSGLTTLINSSNGTDITSSFQTFLYIPVDDDNIAQSNLTDRSLAPRQAGRTVRSMIGCRHQPSLFQFSQCNHIPNHFDAMRRWNVTCKLPPYLPGSRTITEIVRLVLEPILKKPPLTL